MGNLVYEIMRGLYWREHLLYTIRSPVNSVNGEGVLCILVHLEAHMSRKEPKGSPKSNQSKQKSLERKNAQANRRSKHIDKGTHGTNTGQSGHESRR